MNFFHVRLHGEPSPFSVALKEEWQKKEPRREKGMPWDMTALRLAEKYHREKCIACAYAIGEKYHVSIFDPKLKEENKGKSLSEMFAPSMFYVDVEYSVYGEIFHISFINMDLDTLKNLFRDLYHLGLCPVMHYVYHSGKLLHLTGCSLGSIRRNYLMRLGIEPEHDFVEHPIPPVRLRA